jgi:hypothetical protein
MHKILAFLILIPTLAFADSAAQAANRAFIVFGN